MKLGSTVARPFAPLALPSEVRRMAESDAVQNCQYITMPVGNQEGPLTSRKPKGAWAVNIRNHPEPWRLFAIEVALASIVYTAALLAKLRLASDAGGQWLLIVLATSAYLLQICKSLRSALLDTSKARRATTFSSSNKAVLNYELAAALDPMIGSLVRSGSWNLIMRLIDPELGQGQWDYLHCFESVANYEGTSIEQVNRVRTTVLGSLARLEEFGDLDDTYVPGHEHVTSENRQHAVPYRTLIFPLLSSRARSDSRRLIRETLSWGAEFLSPQQRLAACRVLGNPLMRVVEGSAAEGAAVAPSGMIEVTHTRVDAAWRALLTDMTLLSSAACASEIFADDAYSAGNAD